MKKNRITLLAICLIFTMMSCEKDDLQENLSIGTTEENVEIDEPDELGDLSVEESDLEINLEVVYNNYEDSTLNLFSLQTGESKVLYKVPYNPMGAIAYDNSTGKVYYFNYTDGELIENDLSGASAKVIASGLLDVRAMALDEEARKIYFSEYSTTEVHVMGITAGGTSSVFDNVVGGPFSNVQDMELKNEQLYMTSPVTRRETVFEGNIAQRTITRIVDYSEGGYGYSLAADAKNKNIYFNNVEKAAVMVSDIDGNNVRKFIGLDKPLVYGMKVYEKTDQLIFTTWDGKIHVVDLASDSYTSYPIEGAKRNFAIVAQIL